MIEWLAAAISEAGIVATWGAVLSTIVAIGQTLAFIARRRLQLSTTLFVTGSDDDDWIDIINSSAIPVQVSHWYLEWVAVFPIDKDRETRVAPEDIPYGFRIEPYSKHRLLFSEWEKLGNFRRYRGMNLVLTLHIHGRWRPRRLTVYVEPDG